jgi:hypothetical protein
MTAQQKVDPGQQALRAFECDLPRLWDERPGQSVSYQGKRLLGFAKHKHELYQQCFNQRLTGTDPAIAQRTRASPYPEVARSIF